MECKHPEISWFFTIQTLLSTYCFYGLMQHHAHPKQEYQRWRLHPRNLDVIVGVNRRGRFPMQNSWCCWSEHHLFQIQRCLLEKMKYTPQVIIMWKHYYMIYTFLDYDWGHQICIIMKMSLSAVGNVELLCIKI